MKNIYIYIFLDSAPVFEHEQIGFCGILDDYSSFFSQGKELKLSSRDFEVGKEQWVRLLHLRSSRKKGCWKKKKKFQWVRTS